MARLSHVANQTSPANHRNRTSVPLRKELNGLFRILSKLHVRAARAPLPSLATNITSDYIIDAITECDFTRRQARLVAQTIMNHLKTTKGQITAFRASPVFLLPSEHMTWPLVEWTEDGRDILTLFHFDGRGIEHGTYSWIMHSGTRKSKASAQWLNASVRWDIGKLGHLKLLFGVAQHVLDILEWPISDSLVLYAHLNPRDYSQEKFV